MLCQIIQNVELITEKCHQSCARQRNIFHIICCTFIIVDAVDLTAKSMSDIHSLSEYIESAASTPLMQRVRETSYI